MKESVVGRRTRGFGGTLLAALLLLALPATALGAAPSAPQGLRAEATAAGTVRVTWDPPASNGGQAISDYVIERSTDGAAWTVLPDGTSTATALSATGLADGAYLIRVAAVNVDGTGPYAQTGPASAVAAGAYFACALRDGGRIACWGENGSGQLGIGSTASTTEPVMVAGISGALAITAGESHACAIVADRSVRCWGANSNGQVGDGTTTTPRSTPVAVSGLTDVAKIEADGNGTCAIKTNGSLWCWGFNGAGRLGDGTTTQRPTPVAIIAGQAVRDVAMGDEMGCAVLDADGSVRCWGNGGAGRLGNGASTSSLTPVTVTGLSGVTAIASTWASTCARKDDGTVWCWGHNDQGQLGDGTVSERTAPVQVSGITTAVDVSRGWNHSCARLAGGALRCWGNNGNGQLGDGSNTRRLTPIDPAASGVADVATTYYATCVVRTDGTMQCTGRGNAGETGRRSTGDAYRLSPVRTMRAAASLPAPATAPTQVQLVSRTATTARLRWTAPTSDGGSAITDYAIEQSVAGSGTWTRFADGVSDQTNVVVRDLYPNTSYVFRVAAVSAAGTGTWANLGFPIVDISSRDAHACAALSDGTARCWGYNEVGMLGDGTSTQRLAPAAVTGLTNAAAIGVGVRHSCALTTAGGVLCWGRGENHGQIGIGAFQNRSTPTAVTLPTTATQVAASEYGTCVRLSDSTVWCWGHGADGRLGNGATAIANAPVQVSGLTDAVSVSAAQGHACALRTGGLVSCWGYNVNGETGDGTTTSPRTTPVAVSGLTGATAATTATAVAVGNSHTCVLLQDATVACWGVGSNGQIGDGGNVRRAAPTAVPGLNGITAIAAGSFHTCALDGSGDVRCWGYGPNGQLGDEAMSNQTTPVRVVGLPPAAAIRATAQQTCALLVDGGTRCWGVNSGYSMLGDGLTANTSSPTTAVSQQVLTNLLPDPPRGLTARWASTTSARLGFSPSNARGALVTDYIASYSSDGGATWTTFADGTSKVPTIVVTGLQQTRTYMFRVAAVNANGTSRPATAASATSIATGANHACAALADGSVVCTGANGSGQLASGLTSTQFEGQAAEGLSGALQVAAGSSHSCARITGGAVRCWGSNASGQLGDGTTSATAVTRPIAVPALTGTTSLAAGGSTTCVIRSDQTAACWGNNASGQAGSGTIGGNVLSPTAVAGLGTVTQIAPADNSTCALLTTRQVHCWGHQGSGRLGDGVNTGTNRATPAAVETAAGVPLADVVEIGHQYATGCAVRANGTVWCWGDGGQGQIGDGTTTARSRATQVSGITTATHVDVGYLHACALLGDGTVRCWGHNGQNQIGDGTGTQRLTPVAVRDVAGAVDIAVNEYFACARLATGAVRCWGRNNAGQLGDNSNYNRASAVVLRGIGSALAGPAAPSAPTGISFAERTATTATLAFSAPDNTGGTAITDYVAEYAIAGTGVWTVFDDGVSTSNRIAITGLRPTLDYAFRVSAVNAAGRGEPRPMLQNATRVGFGDNHACALQANGSVLCWGNASNGRRGDGQTSGTVARATTASGLANAVQIAVGAYFTCATTADGLARCWGQGSWGNLGNNSTGDRSTPTTVTGLSGVAEVAVGFHHACARTTAGEVWCWGYNAQGQVGDGTTTQRALPVQVSGITNAVGIAAGGLSSCAVLADGGVRCWGNNGSGQLGDATTTNRSTPVAVGGIATATAVVVGDNHACALLADTTVACWGVNNVGQLGDTTTTNRSTRVAVNALDTATQLAAGANHTCALLTGGTVRCWGNGDSGQLGDGTYAYATIPVGPVLDGTATAITAGRNLSCATVDASAACWGQGGEFRIGDASNDSRPTPVQLTRVTTLANRPDPPINLAVEWASATSALVSWGAAAGRGATVTDYRVEWSTDNGATWTVFADGVSTAPRATVTGLATGVAHQFRVSALNANGASLPAKAASATALALGDYFSCARLADGSASCWGDAGSGQLAGNNFERRLNATQADRLPRASAIAANASAACALASGAVWCWGNNGNGQLGEGTATNASEPVRVQGIADATAIGVGNRFACAIRTGGGISCWGINSWTNLGDASTTQRSTPVAVAGLPAGNAPVQLALGEAHSCALLTDATVACWGYRGEGRIGDGGAMTGTNQTTPVIVQAGAGALGDVAEISTYLSHTCARKTDGTVWCWGQNSYGQLGDGSTTNRASAVQMTGIANAIDIATGWQNTCVLLQGGTARCIGRGSEGQLGDGTNSNRTALVTVGGLTGATEIEMGIHHTCAITASGAVQCWGYNIYGQVGDGTTSQRTTPGTVGDLLPDLPGATAPGTPTAITIGTTTATTAALSWTAPSYHGGSPITDYRIEYSVIGTSRWEVFAHAASPAASITVTGLVPQTSYAFRVAAVNAVGTGPYAVAGSTLRFSQLASSADSEHQCALRTDGTVWCWGLNGQRQIDASGTSASILRQSSTFSDVTAITQGNEHTCVLRSNGTIWCWGRGSEGQMGDAATSQRSTPVQVTGITTATAITAGAYHTCALLADQTVRCWGFNSRGQLGDGTQTHRSSPVAVSGISTGTAVTASGESTCALLADGTARCWGDNGWGQLGDGTTTMRLTPVAVTVATGLRSLQLGASFACAVLTDQTASCWGYNAFGTLGDGTTTSRVTAAAVIGVDGVRSLSASSNTACAIVADGGVRCWGNGTSGQLGDGGVIARSIPIAMRGISGATSVNVLSSVTCVLTGAGVARCTGSNSSGQLGDGTFTTVSVPSTVAQQTTLPAAAARPAGLAVVSQTATSATLRWDAVPGNGSVVTGYEVAHRAAGATAWTSVPTTGTNPTVEVTGLATGTSYAFRVRAVNANGPGRYAYLAAPSAVTGGGLGTCAVMPGGGLACWGANGSGQLGDQTTTNRLQPMTPWGLDGATAAAMGTSHLCAIVADGAVRCIGDNGSGQLGDGTTIANRGPVAVALPRPAVAIGAHGSSSCAVLDDGSVRCWGHNDLGQLGDGTQTNRSSPVQVAGISTATAVVVTRHATCVLLAAGTVSCWGSNSTGILGDGTTTNRFTAGATSALGATAMEIAGGESHICARLSDATVRCWGTNANGQLGDGTTTQRPTPTAVSGLSGVSRIVIGGYHSCAVLSTGAMRCWGRNETGQLGDATQTQRTTPVAVSGIASAVAGDGGELHTCVTLADGTMGCWGRGHEGQLGMNSQSWRSTSGAVLGIGPAFTAAASAPGIVRGVTLTSRLGTTVGLSWQAPARNGGSPVTDYLIEYSSNGSTWTAFPHTPSTETSITVTGLAASTTYVFRISAVNAVGTGQAEALPVPGTALAANNSRTCARQSDGTVLCWGYGANGALGQGSGSSTTAVRVQGITSATAVATGESHACALLADRTVRCWGRGSEGQLGDGSTAQRWAPVAVSGLTGAVAIAAGYYHSCALLADATVRCWGYNAAGQIGDGTTTTRPTPTAVSGLSGVRAISANDQGTCAVLTSGGVRCWGANGQGQVGDGTTTNRSTPTAVAGISTATAVGMGSQHACATLANRTVSCWGFNAYGQLGDGTTTRRATPVTADGTADIVELAVGYHHTCALASNGTATCWGAGANGRLGVGDTADRTSPATVAGDTAFSTLTAGDSHTCGIDVGGVVRCWGYNGHGQMGDRTTTDRLRPTAAMQTVLTPTIPGAPSRITAVGGNRRIRLTWLAPTNDGGSPITGYRAYVTTDATRSCTTSTATSATPLTCTISGLTNSTWYSISVRAINVAGDGTASSPINARPTGTQPTGVDDVATAVEAGGVGNGTAGTNPSGFVLLNDIVPDEPVPGASPTVTAFGTGSDPEADAGGSAGTIGQPLQGTYGQLTMQATGAYTYVLDNASPAVDALRAGQSVTDTFHYVVSWGGPTDVGVLQVTVQGANDAPTAADDAATATEASGSANAVAGENPSGNVLANDADPDASATRSVASMRLGATAGSGSSRSVGASANGSYGTFLLRADGSFTYTLDNANATVQALRAGDTLVDAVNYTVTDGSLTSTAVLRVTIQGANDDPVLGVSGNATYLEQGAARILNPAVTITDPDNATMSSATVAITDGYVDGDVLALVPASATMGNIAATWSASAKTLTLTSSGATATRAQWQSALAAIRFSNLVSDNPGTARTLTWTVVDASGTVASASTFEAVVSSSLRVAVLGEARASADVGATSAGASSVAASTSIAVTPVNDAPALSNIALSGLEGQILPFDQGDFTAAYSDPEQTPLESVTVLSLPEAGTLTLDGAPVTVGQTILTENLDSLAYDPPAQDTTTRTIDVLASDGDAASPDAVTTLSFTFYDDPPTTSDAAVSTIRSTAVLLGVDAWGAYHDPEGLDLAAVRITSLPTLGTLEYDATGAGGWAAVTANQVVTAAHLDAGRLRWTPVFGEIGAPYATLGFKVQDGATWSTLANTMTFTVNATNEAPVIAVPTGQVTVEDVPLAFSEALGNGITVADTDSAAVTVTVSIPSGRGAITVPTIASAYVGGNGTTQVLLTGPPDEVNIALSGLRYIPTANASGSGYATVTVTANDRFLTSTRTVVIDVTDFDDPPTLTRIYALGGATEDTPGAIGFATLLAASNAADAEGQTITFRVAALSSGTLTKDGNPAVAGTTTIAAGETLVWTPAANATGTLNAFTVEALAGGKSSSAVQVRVTVAGVNDAPTTTDDQVTVEEDGTILFSEGDFGTFSDPEGSALSGIRIATVPAAGSLQYFDGSAWTTVVPNQVISADDIGTGRLRFVPAANATGAPYAQVGFRVGDGVAYSAAVRSVAIDVTPVADAPTLDSPPTLTFTDGPDYETFSTRTGTLQGSTPDQGVTLTYAAAGATPSGGTTVVTGDYGTLTVFQATGAYSFAPNRNAINRLSGDASETYGISLTDSQDQSATGTVTISIAAEPEEITVTPDLLSKYYGDADPALTYLVTAGALIGSDQLTGSLSRAAGSDVGTYAITAGTLAAGPEYELTVASRSFEIDPRPITVTADAKVKVYGDGDPALTRSVTSGGLIGTDALTGQLTRAPGDDAGTYAIQVGTLSAGPNYELTFAGANLVIDERPVTLSGVTAVTRQYDRTLNATLSVAGASVANMVSGDTLTVDATGATAQFRTATVGSGKPVDVTGVVLGGADAANYDLTAQPTAVGEIIPRDLTVTGATVTARQYDGTRDAAITGAVLSGVISGDDVQLQNASLGQFPAADAGESLPVTTSMAITGAQASQYNLIQPSLSGSILGAARTIGFTSTLDATYALDATPPTVVAAPSVGGGAITYGSSTPQTCLVDGTTGAVSFVAAGTCTVTATVAAHVSHLSATSAPTSFQITPIAPAAPTIGTVTAGNGVIDAAFTLGATGGAPIANVAYSLDDGQTWILRQPAGTSSPLRISGVRNGDTYQLRLAAIGPGGQSPASAARATMPIGPPEAPTGVIATAGNAAATITWSAPARDTGSPITGYTVTAAPGGASCVWTSGPLTCTIATLQNGTAYTFTVRATNAIGDGAESAPSAAVTPAAPPVEPASPVELDLSKPPAISDSGGARIPVSCQSTGTCRVTMSMVFGTQTIATEQRTIPAGGGARIVLDLPPAYQDRLALQGRLKVKLVSVVETEDGEVRTVEEVVLIAPIAEAATGWAFRPASNGDQTVVANCIGERTERCAGEILLIRSASARQSEGTVVGRAEIVGQGGQPMEVRIPLNATGRRILAREGELKVDRIIRMEGATKVTGRVKVVGGARAAIRVVSDREWLRQALAILEESAPARATLNHLIDQLAANAITEATAAGVARRDVLPLRERAAARLAALPAPSKRLRAADVLLRGAIERSIAADRAFVRAFSTGEASEWGEAWEHSIAATAIKERMIEELQRVGTPLGIDVREQTGIWP